MKAQELDTGNQPAPLPGPLLGPALSLVPAFTLVIGALFAMRSTAIWAFLQMGHALLLDTQVKLAGGGATLRAVFAINVSGACTAASLGLVQ